MFVLVIQGKGYLVTKPVKRSHRHYYSTEKREAGCLVGSKEKRDGDCLVGHILVK